MGLPIDPRDLLRSAKRLSEDRDAALTFEVLVEGDAPDALLDALQAALVPRTAKARVAVAALGDAKPAAPAPDALVLVLGSGAAAAVSAADDARRRGVPVAVVALREDAEALAASLGEPIEDVIACDSADRAVELLARWFVDRVPEKRLAVAHNFTFVRRAVAGTFVRATAWQNGAIGAVAIIPGADLPLMTANQAKMLLQIAAAYGQPLSAERVRELAVVVGGGFTLRAVARQFVGLVPGFGWAVKGGIGYAGTVAMGEAAIAYFEQGADLRAVTRRVLKVRAKAIGDGISDDGPSAG
ncbi:MAG: hypothetical protein WC971_08065 [Coriobacteriia bacterium]